ncbi:MAG TPA: sigma-70 family RNA polymerase sigma factor [Firmicutes bacterium]|nr:sigma-70 family RNA polymerase sigma factor [Bacillota bacterium]
MQRDDAAKHDDTENPAGSLAEKAPVDVEVVQKAMVGDKKAFSSLFMQTYRPMYLVVRKYLQQDEDIYDALQNGYIRAYRHLPRLRAPEAFFNWLKRIMENEAKELLCGSLGHMAGQVSFEEYAQELSPDMDGHTGPVESAERRADLQEALNRLDPRQTEVLTLHYYDGLKLSEIAKLLNEPQSTVRSRLAAAKKALVKELKIKGIDRSMYSGSMTTMIAVSLRSLIGTDVLSAAVAQQMLDGILHENYTKEMASARRVIEKQRNRAVLRAVSLLMALAALVSCLTAVLINGFPWKWLSSLQPAGLSQSYDPSEPSSSPPSPSFSAGASTVGSGGTGSQTDSSGGTTPVGSSGSQGTAQGTVRETGSTTAPQSGSSVSRTTVPKTTGTTEYDPFPSYDTPPGYGNDPNHLMNLSGSVAEEDGWIYYSAGPGFADFMKVKTDGTQNQRIEGALDNIRYLNIVGDWSYFAGGNASNSLYFMPTGGGHQEMTPYTCRYFTVIDGIGYYLSPHTSSLGIINLKGFSRVEPAYKLDIDCGAQQAAFTGDYILYRKIKPAGGSAESSVLTLGNLSSGAEREIADAADFLVNGNTVYYPSGGSLYSLDYTDPSAKPQRICADFPSTANLLFFNPADGAIGYMDSGCHVLTADGQKRSWPSDINIHTDRSVSESFYVIDGYVYFYSPDNELCRARSDGSDYRVLS